MIKIKARAMIGVILLLLPLAPSLIQPVKANSNIWEATWQDYQWNTDPEGVHHPITNLTTTTTVYSEDESQWVKIALVVSVYDYVPYENDDVVVFRVALYYDSFADETMLPVPAYTVTLSVQKDTEGSNLNDQCMEVRYSDTRPGFAQGDGLDQSSYLNSTQNNREWWALEALDFAAGLFCEPISVVTGLISLANAWAPQAGVDYDNAGYSETGLYSWWHDPGYDFGLENPVRQYAFNTIEWVQHTVNPSTYYGIKVWARVVLHTRYNNIAPSIDTAPVYLRIHHNYPPNTPSISGPASGYTGSYYNFYASTTDPNGDDVRYTFSWGDGTTTTTGWIPSGYTASASHSWSSTGTYDVKVRAQDVYGAWSGWSESLPVIISSDEGNGDGGGPGCPILSVYDGTTYVEEGLLDIHNLDGVDMVTSHVLTVTPEPVEHRYLMRLTEHPQTHSHIDQVKLLATLKNGTEIKLPLVSAVHSDDGNVLWKLLFSDDVRADTLGADHNNGTSEWIDLKFWAPRWLEIEEFTFVIEGHNIELKE